MIRICDEVKFAYDKIITENNIHSFILKHNLEYIFKHINGSHLYLF